MHHSRYGTPDTWAHQLHLLLMFPHPWPIQMMVGIVKERDASSVVVICRVRWVCRGRYQNLVPYCCLKSHHRGSRRHGQKYLSDDCFSMLIVLDQADSCSGRRTQSGPDRELKPLPCAAADYVVVCLQIRSYVPVYADLEVDRSEAVRRVCWP